MLLRVIDGIGFGGGGRLHRLLGRFCFGARGRGLFRLLDGVACGTGAAVPAFVGGGGGRGTAPEPASDDPRTHQHADHHEQDDEELSAIGVGDHDLRGHLILGETEVEASG